MVIILLNAWVSVQCLFLPFKRTPLRKHKNRLGKMNRKGKRCMQLISKLKCEQSESCHFILTDDNG